ncbi:HNH endonuclease signature motif containing protein [Kutzneria sp. CA-103260]|uniref:HNH endonuclease signature motif containing protein n=1 Tax=Kutzneria sp. CA-103260 TaxID=2802641 RepID=UPI001BAACB9C|nr:HNH endonuclease signature motif containing protein [Kutzneria sp. CA-103260]QUQ63117.1 hypothetical protein JJ691_08290 [Kutzneria sp. CA-103260]
MEATLTVDAQWWRMVEGSLWAAGQQSQDRQRAEYVRQVELVGELWDRTAQGKDDQRALVADLAARWKITRAEARDLLRHAQLFRREAVREAARAGVLSKQHLTVLDKTLAEAPEPDRDKVEAELLDKARLFDGAALRMLGQRILQLLDQDGKEPNDPDLAEPDREFHYTNRCDGSMVFRGKLDPESGAQLEAMLSPLAKPTSADDTRTTAQRQGDALAEIIDLAAGSDSLPDEGGEKPHLALTMPLADFLAQRGTAEMDGSGPLNAASTRRLACDSTVLRVVLGAQSQPLDIGRASRTIPNQIRRALIIRDRGCAFPGCHRRPRQCHAHHVIHWADGGPTSMDNLVLLCGQHHRLIHHSHWSVTINDGAPEFGWSEDPERPVGDAGARQE